MNSDFQNPDPFPSDGAAPPVTSGDLQPIEPPETWPTVIGVLGIIFAALALLGGVCGLAGTAMGGIFTDMVPEEQKAQMAAQMQYAMPYPALQWGAQFIEFVIAIVLLVGAIQLLRRSRSAPRALKGYAWADLVSNFIGAAVGMLVVTAQAQAVRDNPELLKNAGPFGAGAGSALGMGFVIGIFLLSGIWPVFLLIWFGRDKIRDAVDRWDGGPGIESDFPAA